MSRKYLPTLSELVDRLSIAQLKEVFIPEHKEEYAKEIKDIMHDINLEGVDAELIRSVVVLSQMNLHIWHNESNYRKGIKDGNNLELTRLAWPATFLRAMNAAGPCLPAPMAMQAAASRHACRTVARSIWPQLTLQLQQAPPAGYNRPDSCRQRAREPVHTGRHR